MTSTQIITTVIVIVVVVVLAIIAAIALRRAAMRRRFADEYGRLVDEHHGHLAAYREMRGRQRRHAQLEVHELPADVSAEYARQWRDLQAEFVTDPRAAVAGAQTLITRVVGERGYPVADHDESLALLSVEHASILDDYRQAHAISTTDGTDGASTEQLRQALVHYRAIFVEMVGDASVAAGSTEAPTVPASTPVTAATTADPDSARQPAHAAPDDDVTSGAVTSDAVTSGAVTSVGTAPAADAVTDSGMQTKTVRTKGSSTRTAKGKGAARTADTVTDQDASANATEEN